MTTAATPHLKRRENRRGQQSDGLDEHEKRDRQMIELLNELRVALPGVQILFAFLLTIPFAQGWENTTAFQRDVYFLVFFSAVLSTACLIAPSAAHRVRFHKSDRAFIIESANRLMIAGLFFLGIALTGTVVLISDVLFGDVTKIVVVPLISGLAIFGLWFVWPLTRHARGRSSGP